MANQQPPPTRCEVRYDEQWLDLSDIYPHIPNVTVHHGVSSAKSHPGGRVSSHKQGSSPRSNHVPSLMLENASMASYTPSFHTYYDYLKNYYWEHPSTHNNGALTSPSLPARSQTCLAWCSGGYGAEGGGEPVGPRGGERSHHLSLPALPHTGQHGGPGEEAGGWGEDRKAGGHHDKLVWVDALNAWVTDKKPHRSPFVSFINQPPRVERFMYSKEDTAGKHGDWPSCQCNRFEDHMRLFRYKHPEKHLLLRTLKSSSRRGKEDQRRLHRKSYSTPLYDPESLRKSRQVRFEAPRSARSTSPQQPLLMAPEQIDVPLADWEDELPLEGESFEVVEAAQVDHQECVVVVLAREPSPEQPLLEVVTIHDPPVVLVSEHPPWPLHLLLKKAEEERVPTPPPPEPEVVEDIPEVEKSGLTEVSVVRVHPCYASTQTVVPDTATRSLVLARKPPLPPDVTDSKPVATSSPRPPPKAPSPLPPPAEDWDSSSSDSMTPPPTPPPVVKRRPTVVETEESSADNANLAGLMSRLSSIQRARPKPKPKKVKQKDDVAPKAVKKKVSRATERPAPERTPKPPRPKPVEKPPPPPPPKPVKQPKPPAQPKPVKQPRPPKPKPEPKEKKIIPKPTPKPAPKPPPPVKEKKPKTPKIVYRDRVEEEPEDKPEPLTVSPPEERWPSPTLDSEDNSPPPTPSPPPPPVVHHRAAVKKKEKLAPPPPRRRTPTPPPQPPTPVFEHKERDMYSSDEEETKEENKEKPDSDRGSPSVQDETVTIDLPNLPSALPEVNHAGAPRSGGAGGRGRIALGMPMMALASKPRWGQKQKDTSLMDEEERERLAEERRKRFAALMDRGKTKKTEDQNGSQQSYSDFDDYYDRDSPPIQDGFLGKYCIFNHTTREKYRHTFNILDETGKGYLTEEETALGMGCINPNLKDSEIAYLFRVLEIVGHKVKDGTDLNIFCLLAAMSQRVSKLDDWAHCEWARKMMSDMGQAMSETDYKNMERKMFLCRTLWECNVDDSTATISRDQLLVEVRAGGLSPQHEQEILDKMPSFLNKLLPHEQPQQDVLSGLPRSLDFFDFLLYVPLFIMIHEGVVSDPLSLSRTA